MEERLGIKRADFDISEVMGRKGERVRTILIKNGMIMCFTYFGLVVSICASGGCSVDL